MPRQDTSRTSRQPGTFFYRDNLASNFCVRYSGGIYTNIWFILVHTSVNMFIRDSNNASHVTN